MKGSISYDRHHSLRLEVDGHRSYCDKVCRKPMLLLSSEIATPPTTLSLVNVGNDSSLAEGVLVILVRLVVVHGLQRQTKAAK